MASNTSTSTSTSINTNTNTDTNTNIKTNMKTTTPDKNTRRKTRQIFKGTFIHSKSLTELEVRHGMCVFVDEEGVIVGIFGRAGDEGGEGEGEGNDGRKGVEGFEKYMKELGWDGDEEGIEYVVFEGASNERDGERFFFPGFIDTHIHAPQYPNSGLFGSSTLLNWLNTYTFPLESSLSSLSKAQPIYSRVIRRTLSHGTTTAAYYATIHIAATNLLADLCLKFGQRALVGRCCMDSSTGANPDYYRDANAAESLEKTRKCVAHCEAIDPGEKTHHGDPDAAFRTELYGGIDEMVGELAREKNLPIQTHISENRAEIAWVGGIVS